MRARDSLSISQARRIALAAQQFAPQPTTPRSTAAFSRLVNELGAVQIDSVNVLVRSHYLPVFSRRGAYDRTLLERASYEPMQRRLSSGSKIPSHTGTRLGCHSACRCRR